jgi:hypothetical protein
LVTGRDGCLTPGRAGRLTVGNKITLTLTQDASLSSSVGITRVRFPVVQDFSLSTSSRRLCGPPSPLSNGDQASVRGVKRQRRETNHSPPFSAKVKKNLAISLLLHAFPWNSA